MMNKQTNSIKKQTRFKPASSNHTDTNEDSDGDGSNYAFIDSKPPKDEPIDSPDTYFQYDVSMELETNAYDHTPINSNLSFLPDPASAFDNDLIPAVAVSLHSIGDTPTTMPLLGLLDSGGSHVMIQRNCLPSNCVETPTNKPIYYNPTTSVIRKDILLPEFNKVLRIPVTHAYVCIR
jgi:hypothetical protein